MDLPNVWAGEHPRNPARLNLFLNVHRPCLFGTEVPDPRKAARQVYDARDAMMRLVAIGTQPLWDLTAGVSPKHPLPDSGTTMPLP